MKFPEPQVLPCSVSESMRGGSGMWQNTESCVLSFQCEGKCWVWGWDKAVHGALKDIRSQEEAALSNPHQPNTRS